MRPGNAYGEQQKPYRGQGFIATAIASILESRKIVLFGENGTVRDYIHADDIALGILAVLEAGKTGETYNIGTGIGHSNRDILNYLVPMAESARLKVSIEVQPERSFDVKENILDYSKLKDRTGWSPCIRLEDGLKRIWNCFLSIRVRGSQA